MRSIQNIIYAYRDSEFQKWSRARSIVTIVHNMNVDKKHTKKPSELMPITEEERKELEPEPLPEEKLQNIDRHIRDLNEQDG